MVKYFRNGFSVLKVDTDKNEVTNVTDHPTNKGIVYSFGMEMIAESMIDSLNSQIGILRPGGVMTVEVDENEYNTAKAEVKNYFISGSVNF